VTDALSAFPLHQLTTVQTSTINNNSVSVNQRDVLPLLLRFNDRRSLQRYNGMAPVAYDTVGDYAQAVGTLQNPLGSFTNSADNDLLPRGSFVLDGVSKNLADVATSGTPLTPNYTGDFYIQVTSSEALMLSPFIWSDPKSNNQAIYGVQNLNFVFNIGDASRVWRSANGTSRISAISVSSFTRSELLFNFLTPHPSDLMPPRNCVSFYETPRYISTFNGANLASGASSDYQSNSLQINQVPDKLIICVRKALGTQTWADADAFMTINRINLQFNNASGLLSSATVQDLYRFGVENGSNQSFQEFIGKVSIPDPVTGAGRILPTTGSLLVLDFGKDIQLSEDFYASGSLGNFNLQIRMNVTNNLSAQVNDLEFVVITMNSGVFCCERGTSSTYTGILTKQDVLDASAQQPYFKSDAERIVGGGFLDSLKSVVGRVLPMLMPEAKKRLGQMDSPYGKAGEKVLDALGYGRSGGGASGGMKHKLADRLA
jgi:hypothetical protein